MMMVRLFNNLPIACKLAASAGSALTLLAGVSGFSLHQLTTTGAIHEDVEKRIAAESQLHETLARLAEFRIIAVDIARLQTVGAIKAQVGRMEQEYSANRAALVSAENERPDQASRDQLGRAVAALDTLVEAIQREATARTDLITARQKRLLQMRPTFENAVNTLVDALQHGGGTLSGVDAVVHGGSQQDTSRYGKALAALNAYRLDMARMQNAVVMFLATSNGAAANEVKDAAGEAETEMDAVMASEIPESIKSDARNADVLGKSLSQAALDLIEQVRHIDIEIQGEIDTAAQSMKEAIVNVAMALRAQAEAANGTAANAQQSATRALALLVGGCALLMIVIGTATTLGLTRPMRRMATVLQAMAAGDTETSAGFAGRRDEIGRMATAVETLRDVMRHAFVQSRMIEQMPFGVMLAEASGEFRITYTNAETARLLEPVKQHLAVPPDQIVGKSVDVFHRQPERQRAILSNPGKLPHHARVSLGDEEFEVLVSAIFDRHGAYAGPMITWSRVTEQAQLVDRFESSVKAIADKVDESAAGMQASSRQMSAVAKDAVEHTTAVVSACEQATGNVNTAAAGAEELAASVAEIARQVAESADIAAQAVREAESADKCIGGLNEAADRIGDVVRLIGDIAGRTNLLALNATIEAARAGEAGKGFAVVASEVKTLANQTARATEDIGAQISTMQSATSQAVSALRSIAGTIHRMNEIAVAIAGAVEEQGAATRQIACAVQQAASDTQNVNHHIGAVGTSVRQTGQEADIVLDAANQLSQQSAVLKREVEAFLDTVRRTA